ncbi:substrate-binding domain-containing protein [Sphingomonas sp. SUN019]|uniref:LacI family DNA-binding transcriptional regulator n=1 Tax=Sphingomonas sp. SUN019 TaxID=2937788 RepID=UPI002164E3F6|nr:substrate-binding domain-containing protein [Sphingomonas sp. SUN019]UVO49528.1 substrate-binding domain-containing protein [Sphingomonas sp. SUN019]
MSSTEQPVDVTGTRVRTIVDLAKVAGVSPGTVSRALAGSPLVNPATRDRIQTLAAAHDFRLNQMASRLRTKRTGVIGVVVPLGHERRQHLSDPFFMTMLGHLADALTEIGYDLMLSRVIPDAPDWLERIVDSGMLDGVLLLGQSDQRAAIERVAERYRPLVVWGGLDGGQAHCSVGTDNHRGGWLAGEHLLAQGARRIAFLGDVHAPELDLRFAGLSAALAAAGAAPPVMLETHLATDVMYEEIAVHLDRHGGAIDGIFAGSDAIAMMTLRALADHGIKVPHTVRVVGYDDLPLAVQTVPRITTVRQEFAAGAKAMVERLLARMGGVAMPSLVLAPTLVVRGSSDATVEAGGAPTP